MGRFVLLNGTYTSMAIDTKLADTAPGILQHAWRTKRVLQQNVSAMPKSAFQAYSKSKEYTVHQALRRWREGWPQDLLDFEPLPERPSLYQDRAEAYWYLSGVIMLPHVAMSSPKISVTLASGVLFVEETLKRLILLSDRSLLPTIGQDYHATFRLVTEQLSGERSDRALGALIYGEVD